MSQYPQPTGRKDDISQAPATAQDRQVEESSHSPAPLIPNLGHAVLFCGGTFVILVVIQGLFFGFHHSLANTASHAHEHNTKLMLGSMAAAYVCALLLATVCFPALWQRPWAIGIHWNGRTAMRHAARLAGLGLVLGWTVQAISTLIPMPKSLPIDDFFRTRLDIWLVAAFGTLLAPLFEEIAFRGFLLPAIASSFDWFAAASTSPAPDRWVEASRVNSTASLVFSAVITSALFALLHASQLAHAWGAVSVLFCVSLVLTIVRLRTGSVAASAIVHAAYNFSVFLTLFLATGGLRHLDRITR